MARKFSDNQEKHICKEYMQGKNANELANKYNCNYMTMLKLLERNGVRLPKKKITNEDESEVCRGYLDSMSTNELGLKYNVHPNTIRRVLKRHGIPLRPRGHSNRKFTDAEEKQICKEYEQEMTAKELADKYGINEMTVGIILKRNGIKSKRRKINNKDEKQICKDYELNKTIRELANEYNDIEGTIKSVLEKNGVKLKLTVNHSRKRRKVTQAEEEQICKEYINGLSSPKLAIKYNRPASTITKILERNNIKRNNPGKSARLTKEKEKKICTEYEIVLSTQKLGKKYNVSPMTIHNILKKHGIKTRKRGSHSKLFTPEDEEKICKEYLIGTGGEKLSKKYKILSKSLYQLLERNGVKIRSMDEIYNLFTDEEQEEICKEYQNSLSANAIAMEKGCSPMTIANILEKHGIEKRDHKGKFHSNWKGGISFGPYCPKFNEEFRERVREFWQRKCGICGMAEEENFGRLSVHHVNYDKKACCDNIPPLFIPLCSSCHAKTNHNRELWENYLTSYIMVWFDGESYIHQVSVNEKQITFIEILED